MKFFFFLMLFAPFCPQICYGQLAKENLDPLTTNSLFVLVKNGKDTLGNATAFTVKVDNTIYLITNNHVAGGEYFTDDFIRQNNRLPKQTEMPDSLLVRFYNKKLFEFTYIPIPVNNEKGEANYIKFYANEKAPSHGNIFDIVAFKLPTIDTSKIIITPYTAKDFNPTLTIIPASELFVIGFPLDYGKNILLYPIWKRGTVASDTKFNWFYIDATTRFGMSGSPVIYRGNSYTTTTNNYSAGSIFTFLVGIYCKQDPPTEIGMITKIDFVFDKLFRISK
jgi:hypothetical protein